MLLKLPAQVGALPWVVRWWDFGGCLVVGSFLPVAFRTAMRVQCVKGARLNAGRAGQHVTAAKGGARCHGANGVAHRVRIVPANRVVA